MSDYGAMPLTVGSFPEVDLVEFMHYQYLPIKMADGDAVRLPARLYRPLRHLVHAVISDSGAMRGRYVYVTARCGYATPDNPLNRPGWHCDGFGTEDINYVWWDRWSSRFAHQPFHGIVPGHVESMRQFEEQIKEDCVVTLPDKVLYRLDPFVVHATPLIDPPGGMRQFVKVSVSEHRYNLLGNSHNHAFDYCWQMHPRDAARNDPHYGEADFVPDRPTPPTPPSEDRP